MTNDDLKKEILEAENLANEFEELFFGKSTEGINELCEENEKGCYCLVRDWLEKRQDEILSSALDLTLEAGRNQAKEKIKDMLPTLGEWGCDNCGGNMCEKCKKNVEKILKSHA